MIGLIWFSIKKESDRQTPAKCWFFGGEMTIVSSNKTQSRSVLRLHKPLWSQSISVCFKWSSGNHDDFLALYSAGCCNRHPFLPVAQIGSLSHMPTLWWLLCPISFGILCQVFDWPAIVVAQGAWFFLSNLFRLNMILNLWFREFLLKKENKTYCTA